MTDTPTPLCCPLCGHDEYLLSDKNQFLCAKCGAYFEDVTQVNQSIRFTAPLTLLATTPNATLCH